MVAVAVSWRSCLPIWWGVDLPNWWGVCLPSWRTNCIPPLPHSRQGAAASSPLMSSSTEKLFKSIWRWSRNRMTWSKLLAKYMDTCSVTVDPCCLTTSIVNRLRLTVNPHGHFCCLVATACIVATIWSNPTALVNLHHPTKLSHAPTDRNTVEACVHSFWEFLCSPHHAQPSHSF